MSNQFLEFEKPLADILEKIAALREASKEDTSLLKEIQSLEDEELKLRKKIFSKLSIWQKVQVARHPQRPHISDFIPRLFSDFDELHGDRQFADDASIIGGLATFENIPVMIVGHEKGRETSEKVKRNFGMAQPEGYRKAKRLFQLAERFSLPVITFIDTAGAYPGVEGEERGQSEAIAQNLAVMSKLRTPIIVVVTGEGGSGGALAIGVGDHVAIFEHAIYSVASPEACASIVWRSSENAPDAAEAMKVSAQELIKIGIVDEIIPEPSGGAHRDYEEMATSLKKSITDALSRLDQQTIEEMLESRYQRLLRIGS
jgi:acetyl-CoA carboxylase carboxyl transferase subunit alpha